MVAWRDPGYRRDACEAHTGSRDNVVWGQNQILDMGRRVLHSETEVVVWYVCVCVCVVCVCACFTLQSCTPSEEWERTPSCTWVRRSGGGSVPQKFGCLFTHVTRRRRLKPGVRFAKNKKHMGMSNLREQHSDDTVLGGGGRGGRVVQTLGSPDPPRSHALHVNLRVAS